MNIEEHILTVEQARRLQNEFGIDMDDAAIWYVRLSPANDWDLRFRSEDCVKLFNNEAYRECYCPTYTLEEVLSKYPKAVTHGFEGEKPMPVTFGTFPTDPDYLTKVDFMYWELDPHCKGGLLQSAYNGLLFYLKNLRSGFYEKIPEKKKSLRYIPTLAPKSEPLTQEDVDLADEISAAYDESIKQKVIEIIDDKVGNGDEFTLDTRLGEYCDSLDQIEIVMELEKEYGIAIPDEELCQPKWEDPTVGEVVGYIQQIVKE